MSQLRNLISSYDAKLTEASAKPDLALIPKIFEEFKASVKSLRDCTVDIREELSATIRGTSQMRIDLLLAAASIHADLSFVDHLCTLLAINNPAVSSEVIVDILCKIPSPKAIPYLTEACTRKFSHDAYDEFGVKCLEALASINTPDSWSAIETAFGSPSDRIRNRARELSDWRKSRPEK